MAVSEINYYNKAVKGEYYSENNWYRAEGNKNSVICAYIICALLFLFFLFSIMSWCWNLNTINVDNDCMTGELYVGLRKFP